MFKKRNARILNAATPLNGSNSCFAAVTSDVQNLQLNVTNTVHPQTANHSKSSTLLGQVKLSATTFADERSTATCIVSVNCSEPAPICSELICSTYVAACSAPICCAEAVSCTEPGEKCEELIQSAMLLSAAIAMASSLTGLTTCTTCETEVSSCITAAAAKHIVSIIIIIIIISSSSSMFITRHSLVERRARYLVYCMFVCLFVNDFSTTRGPIHAIFCMRA